MKRRLRLRARSAPAATCFCDACATVTNCDTSHRVAAVRDEALIRALLHR